MEHHPLLSIITVTRNDAHGLEATLDSVARQTGGVDYRQIVIDGASTDGSAAVMDRFMSDRTLIISEPDNGIYDAMNKGLAHADGQYVMFLNAGDTLHDAAVLDDIARAIRDNGTPGVVYGQTDIVDPGDRHRIGPRHLTAPATLTLDSFKQGMVVCHQAFIALRRIVSPYDLKYRFSADYEWCIRILQHSRRNVYLPRTIVDYADGGATTAHRRASLLERYRIMCHYYGAVSSTLRHGRFVIRAIRRNFSGKERATDI